MIKTKILINSILRNLGLDLFALRMESNISGWKFNRIKESDYPNFVTKRVLRDTGQIINLQNPKTFNDKIKWMDIYDNSFLKTMLTDKHQVKQWVAEKIGNEYVVPLYGVWGEVEQIDFSKLPNQFVLKSSSGGRSRNVLIVKDKNKLKINQTKKLLQEWLIESKNFGKLMIKKHYWDIPPRIIAEKCLESKDDYLIDYKFLCFNGTPEVIRVCTERGSTDKRYTLDLDWKPLPFSFDDYPEIHNIPAKPDNFDKMVQIVKTLSNGFNFVRVDLYNLAGKIYFGEMTFSPQWGGYIILPSEYNRVLGDMIKLPIDDQN